MAHLRERHLRKVFRKSLKLWPVVSLFGPRQCGKSTFLRELFFEKNQFSYAVLDHARLRDQASQNPELFLSSFEKEPIVIDEAQKAPPLFDEIKAMVDSHRRPGRFVLTGSVAFSKRIGIRESLTGRSSVVRMDSMTLSETTSTQAKLKDLLRYFRQGGMPGVCFLRNENEVKNYWDQWIETVLLRDLLEYGKKRLSSDIAYKVLKQTALLEYPSAYEIGQAIRVDTRRVQTHLQAMCDLFVLRRWHPDLKSVGKEMFLPFDCGIAYYLGANQHRLFQTYFAHQWINQNRFLTGQDPILHFNLTRRKSFVDFVTESKVYVYCSDAYPDSRMMVSIQAIEKRYPKHQVVVSVGSDLPSTRLSKKTRLESWLKWD